MPSSAELDSTLHDEPSPEEARPRAPLRPVRAQGAVVRGAAPRSGSPRNRCPTCGHEFPSSYLVCPRDATPLGIASEGGDPLIGVVLAGTYRLTRAIGRGGMGRLYEAEHTRLARRFAVKVLHESHADKAEAVRRFEREAGALARIKSDFVLDVVDVLRTPDTRTAIVTALLEGEDLQHRLDRSKRIPVGEAIAITRQICRGLAAAHAVGVVHRDLKPSNLFLAAAPDGRLGLKILDFGVAKLGGDDEMTRTGVVLGTPAYMAPEQARGSAHADPRSDVYAVGAVLYRMLTGRMPFEGSDPGATLARLLSTSPPRPRAIAPDVPVAVEVVIQRAMARDPRERPSSALELEASLAALVASEGLDAEDAPFAAGARTDREGDTLVLGHGVVERAESMERGARRARPLASLLAIATTLASGAAAAGAISAAGTMLGAGEAQAALARALTIVSGIAVTIASALVISRWLSPRWSSAPAVTHASERLGRALASGLATLGSATLVLAGVSAATAELMRPSAIESVVALAAAATVAAVTLRRAR